MDFQNAQDLKAQQKIQEIVFKKTESSMKSIKDFNKIVKEEKMRKKGSLQLINQDSTNIALGRNLSLNMYLKYVSTIHKSIEDGTFDLQKKKIVFILGSESGNSDSICGSLCLSYFYFMKNNGTKHIFIKEAETFHIPLINLSRKSFESQLETLYILDTYDVAKKYLLTLDEVDLEKLVKQENVKVILYDHNYPNSKQRFLTEHIIGIVDHHKDESQSLKNIKLINKDIPMEGTDSACSIVARMIFSDMYKDYQEHPIIKLDMRIFHLLRLVMYIDSFCYKKELKGKKWTFDNHLLWLKLKRFINSYGGEEVVITMNYQKPNFDKIQWDFQKHLKQLTFQQIISKDFKSYDLALGNCGISQIKQTNDDFSQMIKNESFTNNIITFMKNGEFDLLVIICQTKTMKRFLFFGSNLDSINKHFSKNKILTFQALQNYNQNQINCLCYVYEEKQDEEFTRHKSFVPILKEISI